MKRAASTVAWVLLVTAALALWPQRWGGTMTYVLTDGASMAPAFTSGDLAVLRTADDYAVGDVVAYDSPELDRVVLHRIVRSEAGGFALRGDSNDFDDPGPVAPDRVVGRLVWHVPGVGPVLRWATQPAVLAVGVVALLLVVGDRRPQQRPGLAVTAVDLPEDGVVVRVAPGDLHRLAAEQRVPVLELPDGRRCAVVSGAVYEAVPEAPLPAAQPALAAGARVAAGAGVRPGARAPRFS